MLIIGTEIGTSVFVIVQIAEVLRVAVIGVVGRIRVEWVEMGYREGSTYIHFEIYEFKIYIQIGYILYKVSMHALRYASITFSSEQGEARNTKQES